jgi:hypothetical protein
MPFTILFGMFDPPSMTAGQEVLGYNFGKNIKYRRSAQQRCTREEGILGSAQLRHIQK